jgi:hypothetical protein
VRLLGCVVTVHTVPAPDLVEQVRVDAMCDLQDWTDDYAEYLRLDDLLDNPPMGRIPDESYWYAHLIRQWKPLEERWGIR